MDFFKSTGLQGPGDIQVPLHLSSCHQVDTVKLQ